MKVPIFGGFPVDNPTKKATASKTSLREISLSEYSSEGFRVRLKRLSKYGSVAYLVERRSRETQAEQYSDTVLLESRRSDQLSCYTLCLRKTFPDSTSKIGVAQTVFLVNGVLVPCQKGAISTKTAKMTNLHSIHSKQALSIKFAYFLEISCFKLEISCL